MAEWPEHLRVREMPQPSTYPKARPALEGESGTAVTFTVHGVPAPQGSKTRTRWGGMREANKSTQPWREAVAWKATQAMLGKELLAGPLALEATFYFPRPKTHYGTGRNEGVLKDGAPLYCSTTPDTDKLLRAIGDAMKGIVYRDDAQIARSLAWKLYGEPHVGITVERLDLYTPTERNP